MFSPNWISARAGILHYFPSSKWVIYRPNQLAQQHHHHQCCYHYHPVLHTQDSLTAMRPLTGLSLSLSVLMTKLRLSFHAVQETSCLLPFMFFASFFSKFGSLYFFLLYLLILSRYFTCSFLLSFIICSQFQLFCSCSVLYFFRKPNPWVVSHGNCMPWVYEVFVFSHFSRPSQHLRLRRQYLSSMFVFLRKFKVPFSWGWIDPGARLSEEEEKTLPRRNGARDLLSAGECADRLSNSATDYFHYFYYSTDIMKTFWTSDIIMRVNSLPPSCWRLFTWQKAGQPKIRYASKR